MKAIKIDQPGDSSVLKIIETEIPKISPAEVLVKVKASSINHLDIWVRKGLPKTPYPIIPGCDCSGIVEEVGSEISHVKKGDRVFVSPGYSCGICKQCLAGNDNYCQFYGIIGETRDGADAEFISLKGNCVFKLDDKISFESAAASSLVFLTAWQMMVDKAKVKHGDDVFIWGAGSGVGSAGIQIAKLMGGRVIAAASFEAKLELAKQLGADEVINYKKEDVVKKVKELTGKKGVEVVFEHTGSETIPISIQMATKGGKIVTCGATSGWDAKVDLRHIFFRQVELLGSTMGSRSSLFTIFDLIKDGKLKPVIDTVLPMSDVKKAHEHVESAQHFGKVVLVNEW